MQSNKFGLLAALAGLAVAVVLFIVLSNSGEDSEPSGTATTTQPAAEAPAGEGEGSTDGEARKKPKPKPKPKLPRLVIQHGEPVGGPLELEVKSGDRIRFEVKADEPDELHVHGYDQYIEVGPGKPTEVDIKANLEGIFEVESHHTGALLAKIAVVP